MWGSEGGRGRAGRGPEGGDVSLARDGQEFGLLVVEGSQPALGPKLDLNKVCVQRGGNAGAEGGARHERPQSAVISKSINIVVDNIKEIIDEHKKKRGARTLPWGTPARTFW